MPAAVETTGLNDARLKMRGFARRMVLPQPALDAAMHVLEEGEKALFESFDGKYVDTGALEASLTQATANGAIRRAHGLTVEFGTSLWYARFQKRIGPPSGKPRGRKREGRSKIVKASTAERVVVRQLVLDYVMEGGSILDQSL